MSRIVSFPTNKVRLQAGIQRASLREAHSMAQRNQENCALQEKILQREEELKQNELEYNYTIFSIKSELGKLQIERHEYVPSELKEILVRLRKKILDCPFPTTGYLQKELFSLLEQCDQLEFSLSYPIVEELDIDSFQNNFIHRVIDRIQSLQNKHPKKAAQLKKTLLELQCLCKRAREAYCRSSSHECADSIMKTVECKMCF